MAWKPAAVVVAVEVAGEVDCARVEEDAGAAVDLRIHGYDKKVQNGRLIMLLLCPGSMGPGGDWGDGVGGEGTYEEAEAWG